MIYNIFIIFFYTFPWLKTLKTALLCYNKIKGLSVMLSVSYAECQLCWVSVMLGVSYAGCQLCWVSAMLSVRYAECRLCWVSAMLSVGYAECRLFWVSAMLSVVMLSVVALCNIFSGQKGYLTISSEQASFPKVPFILSRWQLLPCA